MVSFQEMVNFRGRIAESQQRIQGLHTKRYMTVKHNIQAPHDPHHAEEIAKIINGDETTIVRQYLHAENVKNINLEEIGEKKFERRMERSGGPSEAVEWTLSFNPNYFNTLKDEKITRIEHELWHFYLSMIFPSLDIKKLELVMKLSCPQAIPFVEPFVHFYLRSAALESDSFVKKDAELDLSSFHFQRKKIEKDPTGIGPAALYCGIIFSTVFAFNLNSGYPDIKKDYQSILKDPREILNGPQAVQFLYNKAIGFGDSEIFVRAYIQAKDIYRDVCCAGVNDLKMENFSEQLKQCWMDFIRKYQPKKMY